MDPSKTIIIPPREGHRHTHTVIFLHGRGGTASGLVDGWFWSPNSQPSSPNYLPGHVLIASFPTFRWVFPQAPLREVLSATSRKDGGPGGGGGGGVQVEKWPQWFDVANTSDFSQDEDIQLPGLRESVIAVAQLIEAEAALLGSGGSRYMYDRIVLAGISMGCATGVHTLFNLILPGPSSNQRLAAFMGFSGRCPFVHSCGAELREMRAKLGLVQGRENLAEGVESEVLKGTPILLEHCVDDPLVLV